LIEDAVKNGAALISVMHYNGGIISLHPFFWCYAPSWPREPEIS